MHITEYLLLGLPVFNGALRNNAEINWAINIRFVKKAAE
jgi:hypothetical protein